MNQCVKVDLWTVRSNIEGILALMYPVTTHVLRLQRISGEEHGRERQKKKKKKGKLQKEKWLWYNNL